jgi:solute carrier family 35 protein E3
MCRSVYNALPQINRKNKETFLTVNVNMISSIAIVLINKHIFVNFGFPNITLTFIHFLVTFIGLIICLQFDIFRFKRLPIAKMIPLSITYCGFVVFTNLSLQYNTVGTYQVIKVLTAPCVMVISYIFYQKKYSFKVQLTLVSNQCV